MMNGVYLVGMYLLGVSTCHARAKGNGEKMLFSEPEPISFLKSER